MPVKSIGLYKQNPQPTLPHNGSSNQYKAFDVKGREIIYNLPF